MPSIKDNVNKIRSEIPKSTILLAATKTRTVEEIRQAISAGITDIGENIIQEAEQKLPLISGVKKHFIGHLQSNKVKKAVELFDVIQSVDSFRIAKKISDDCVEQKKTVELMIEVNIAGEESKFGVPVENVESLYDQMKDLPNIKVIGLMTITPLMDPEKTRPYFRKMSELNKKLKLKHLSMGMTHDYSVAVQEGSTIIRVGTGIFGKR